MHFRNMLLLHRRKKQTNAGVPLKRWISPVSRKKKTKCPRVQYRIHPRAIIHKLTRDFAHFAFLVKENTRKSSTTIKPPFYIICQNMGAPFFPDTLFCFLTNLVCLYWCRRIPNLVYLVEF